MPSPKLDSWLSEQLKKGYSRQWLKQYLKGKGYPASAVEEVDKVKASSGTAKTAATKRYAKPLLLAALVVAGLLVLWGADRLDVFSVQKERQEASLSPVPFDVTTNANGDVMEKYSGTISGISETSITLTEGGKTKEFQISGKKPPVFVIRGSTDRNARVQPNVGDKVFSLLVIAQPKGESYVERVVIDYQVAIQGKAE